MVMLNCEMEFECSQKWDEMPASIDPNVRRCSACRKDVHFCHTVEDLDRAVNEQQCVAFISSEAITNDTALRELVVSIDGRKSKMLKQDRGISITTGIPNYRGGKAFLELGDED
jgi:hypothetical protein